MARTRRKGPDGTALEQFRLGRLAGMAGNRGLAIQHYSEALERFPDFPEALINLGIVYNQLGDEHADDALRCLTRAVELQPKNPRAHYNLGVALSRDRQRTIEAIRAFEATLKIEPNHRNALYGLSVQWTRRGDRDRAASYYRRYRLAMVRAARHARHAGERPVLRIRFRS